MELKMGDMSAKPELPTAAQHQAFMPRILS
jgi:hypothetical protein